MARMALYRSAWLAALILLSACSMLRDSSPPLATLTPIVIITAPTPTPPPSVPTPTHAIFAGPLTVKILEPGDNQVMSTSPIDITGQAEPGTVITIGDDVILVDQSGTFKLSLSLNPGDNLIEITASNTQNVQDFAYFNVIYEPQP